MDAVWGKPLGSRVTFVQHYFSRVLPFFSQGFAICELATLVASSVPKRSNAVLILDAHSRDVNATKVIPDFRGSVPLHIAAPRKVPQNAAFLVSTRVHPL